MTRAISMFIIIAAFLGMGGTRVNAQQTYFRTDEAARSLYEMPPRYLINAATAGTLPRGCFHIVMRVYNGGGMLGETAIGLSNRLMVGMSYGAEKIISDYSADSNPGIEFNIRLRIIDENYLLPAVAVGYNSQGYGAYLEDRERYTYKSKGFFAVISRNFMTSYLTAGGHVGVNYSLENDVDNDKEPTVFFGLDTRFNNNIAMAFEYDMALNDDRASQNYARGRGYLNVGIKWMYSDNLELELLFNDLLQNRKQDATTFGRELRFTYIEFF
nr:hypothetical protein [candidate division Zixibacteria bacterium]